jgi:hypothetical protein
MRQTGKGLFLPFYNIDLDVFLDSRIFGVPGLHSVCDQY